MCFSVAYLGAGFKFLSKFNTMKVYQYMVAMEMDMKSSDETPFKHRSVHSSKTS